jgi:predicted DNA-binding transcriptional regulator AlpA
MSAEVVSIGAARRRMPLSAEPLLTKRQLAARYQVSVRTVERWMSQGLEPEPRRRVRIVRFRLSAVERWMEGQ